MSSESDDVLSLDEGAEEGSFSGFSSLSDSDKEPVASTAPKRKIRSAVKKAKEKGGKSKGKKQPPKKKTVTNKENVQSSSSAGVSTPAKFCSTNWRCSRTVLEHLELF